MMILFCFIFVMFGYLIELIIFGQDSLQIAIHELIKEEIGIY